MKHDIQLAAARITQADAILIGAGAGMGVDSGLPDFRGNQGFWKAYPPMKKLGLTFYDLANPVWFEQEPRRAWGFYGHRRNLYRKTTPHQGFSILKKWVDLKLGNGFVFTSNVDGHFQRAGFSEEQVVECHGSILFSQCAVPCNTSIWQAEPDSIDVDLDTFQASEPLPVCHACQCVGRPNILMFGDYGWIDRRTNQQHKRYQSWLAKFSHSKVAVIEFGAGTAVPTVRYQCETQARRFQTPLIRVNPREAQGEGAISLAMGALDAIQAIDERIGENA